MADFNYKAILTPMEIDIDRFVYRYLGMKIDYRYLSHCGCYLGMTVINDTDEIPVYNPELNCAEMMIAEMMIAETHNDHRQFASGRLPGTSISLYRRT